MIPKIIHYCWFGGKPISTKTKKYIDSWKTIMPDYKLMLWNEDNFDISAVSYVQEAYQAKRFAFVSDYVRLHALKEHGGIYLDTDVEVLKPFDDLLNNTAFTGYEDSEWIQTAVIGSEKDGQWINLLLSSYNSNHFIQTNKSYDTTTNVERISKIMRDKGLVFNDEINMFQNMVTVYPTHYFAPFSFHNGKLDIRKSTYCIHHGDASWMPIHIRLKHKLGRIKNHIQHRI